MEIWNSELKYLVTRKVPARVFTINGFQVRGIITGWDGRCIRVRDTSSKINTICFHAISTITRELVCTPTTEKGEQNEKGEPV